MTTPIIQCAFCVHFDASRTDGNFCTAFPDGDGIPSSIIEGEVDHRDAYEGDHGVRFSAVDPEYENVMGKR